MKLAQTRFTMVRENDRFLGEVSHAARCSRRSFGRIQGHGLSVERCWRKRFVQTRMIDVSRNGVEHDNFARRIAILLRDSGKQVGHFVIVHLGPLLQGMVVTTGASQPQSQKSHSGVLREPDGISVELVKIEGAILPAIARRNQQLPHHLVPGFVLGNRIANPTVVRQDGSAGQSGILGPSA